MDILQTLRQKRRRPILSQRYQSLSSMEFYAVPKPRDPGMILATTSQNRRNKIVLTWPPGSKQQSITRCRASQQHPAKTLSRSTLCPVCCGIIKTYKSVFFVTSQNASVPKQSRLNVYPMSSRFLHQRQHDDVLALGVSELINFKPA